MESWLVIADLDAGKQEGKIYVAAPVDPKELTELQTARTTFEWDARQGVLNAAEEKRVGNLVYESKPIRQIAEEEVIPVICAAIRENPALLSWDEESERFRARVQSLRHWRPTENWPDLSEQTLLETLEAWLSPYLGPIRKADDFAKLKMAEILKGILPWELTVKLDQFAPTHLDAPTGSSIRLEYFPDGAPPVMGVRLQEMFGCFETPAVNGGQMKVMIHLLSPAYRPVQVTRDLKSFWENTYADVRKDIRGRYPKHHWPEDPFTAEPVRGVKRKQKE